MMQQGKQVKKWDYMKLLNLFSKLLVANIVFRGPALYNIYSTDVFSK